MTKKHSHHPKKSKSTWNHFPRLFATGFTMGSADLIPGVSGGTIAFIFGIYQELIESIKIVTGKTLHLILKGKVKEAFDSIPFQFLIPVGGGILIAIAVLANLLSFLLENHEEYVYGLFFGLVVASILIIAQRINIWRSPHIIYFAIAGALSYIFVGLIPVQTPATYTMFFISGMIAISAMILPGISGSFMLLLMGKYQQVLGAVTERDFVVLGIFMIGCVVGITLFSRVLSWLFHTHHDVAVSALSGVMFGSLRKLWPWKETVLTRIDSHGEIVPLVQNNILPPFDLSTVAITVIAITGMAVMFYVEKTHLTDEHKDDMEMDEEPQKKE